MKLTPNDIRKVAHLAQLAIDEAEVDSYVQNLSRILGFVEQMKTVDTTGIQPMAHPLDMVQRLRPDVVTEGNQRELFKSIASLVEDGLYLVPKVIE